MRRDASHLLLTAALICIGAPPRLSAQAQGIVTLSELRQVACPLLLFARKPDGPQLEIQLRTLNEHSAEATDHAIIPIAIPYQSPSPTAVKLSSAESDALRRRFHIAPTDFVVILLGRDGSQLLRSTKPLSMRRLDDAFIHASSQPQP